MPKAYPLSPNFMHMTGDWDTGAEQAKQHLRRYQQATVDFSATLSRASLEQIDDVTGTVHRTLETLTGVRDPRALPLAQAQIFRCWMDAAHSGSRRLTQVMEAWRDCGVALLDGGPGAPQPEEQRRARAASAGATRARRKATDAA